jgi:predicted RNase H-like nuclease
VDGARNGWVVCIVDGRDAEGPDAGTRVGGTAVGGTAVRWRVAADAAEVLAVTGGCVAVGVDIPIGLPTGAARRTCDRLAAARLGAARSSVFPAPPREVLASRTHPDACAVARRLTGRAISLQTFHIGPKIAEWDVVDPPDGVVEVHPELSFRALAPDVAFASKRTVRGAGQRIAALGRWVDVGAALADLPDGVGLDDVLDAFAAAWSAARWARGVAEVLGGEVDERGRPMRMVT